MKITMTNFRNFSKRFPLGAMSLLLALFVFAGCQESAKSTETEPPKTVSPVVDPPRNTNAEDGEKVKRIFENMLELAKAGNCKEIAPLLIYRNTSNNDAWKRVLNFENAEEKIEAEKRCAVLQVLTLGLKNHDYLEFSQQAESEGVWNIWQVKMLYEDGSEEDKAFAFLPVGNSFALGDID